jgi:pyrroloquinoline quinone biosynthesis protein B
LIFIPDIDSWQNFEDRLIAFVESSDYVFIDGTFYENKELKNRDISLIPHPRISDSISLFKATLKREEFSKVHFIHLNHSNPCLDPNSEESRLVNLCEEGKKYYL